MSFLCRVPPLTCAAHGGFRGFPFQCLKGLLTDRKTLGHHESYGASWEVCFISKRAARQERLFFVHPELKYHVKMPPSLERGLSIKFN